MEINLNSEVKLPKRNGVDYAVKKGINLAIQEEKRNRYFSVILYCMFAVAVLLLIAKYGVYDMYEKLYDTQAEYEGVHDQFMETQEALSRYDQVLLEYRTYSMDWLENDESGKYVSVPRRKVLDLIETKVMPLGDVISINISGNTAYVKMKGMDLTEISKMCLSLEESPIVLQAVLQTAATDTSGTMTLAGERYAYDGTTDTLIFNLVIKLQKEAAGK